ncbi:MAG: cytochrome P450 [Polyangiaceae bacterium]
MSLDRIPDLPGARRWFGHLPEVRSDRMGFVRRIAADGRPFLRLRAPFGQLALINDPALVQEVFVEKVRSFAKAAMTRFSIYPLAGEGLFSSDGELWRKQRKLMAPLFHPTQVDSYAGDMVECARRALARFHDGEMAIARETTRITMSVAGKTLFDADTFDEADALGAALTVALDWGSENAGSPLAIGHIVARRTLLDLRAALARRFGEAARVPSAIGALADRLHGPLFLPGGSGAALRDALRVLDDRVARMIADRRRAPGTRRDLLSKLLEARDEDDGSAMSDRQVRDEVLTLFVAGHETTATSLAWALYELAGNPDLYAKAEAEADALRGDPTLEDLPRLPLLLRVFKEALRKYPPVYLVGRDAITDVEIGGVGIPKDTNLTLSTYSLHHRRDLWPEPDRFDPDRFLPEREAARSRFAYLPFGAGPRICIGYPFAFMEGQLVLAAMLRRARYSRVAEVAPEPSATLRPKGDMPMRVRLRAAAAR